MQPGPSPVEAKVLAERTVIGGALIPKSEVGDGPASPATVGTRSLELAKARELTTRCLSNVHLQELPTRGQKQAKARTSQWSLHPHRNQAATEVA
jgi:hypothetical protein